MKNKEQQKKTLLIGPSGFIGPAILEKYNFITCAGRSAPPKYIKNKFIHIKNLRNLKKLDKYDFEYVIFVVGNSNHHDLLNFFWQDDVAKSGLEISLSYNFIPLMHALNYFSTRKIKKFICFSGSLIYDKKNLTLPCKENNKIDPYQNNYLFSKFLAEQLSIFFTNKIPIINIRLSNVYGHSLYERPDIVLSIFNRIIKNKKVFVWNKKPERDFIHVYDLADAVIKLCRSKFSGTINVGSGKKISINYLTRTIEKITGHKIFNKNLKVEGPHKYYHNISKLKKIINWKPRIDLEEGLKLTWQRMKYLNSKYYEKN